MKVYRYELQVVRNGSSTYRVIRNSFDARRMCIERLGDEMQNSPVEKMAVVALDTKNRPIGFYVCSTGTVDASLVEPKIVFARSLMLLAANVILCHNHPSGDLTPSREDIAVTQRLKDVGRILNINVLDHIIMGVNPETDRLMAVSLEELGK
jgi:DNA repair protein RadC